LTSNQQLGLIAIAAFVVGVLLHACVFAAVLNNNGDDRSKNDDPARIVAAPTPVPTAVRLPDRTSCDEIRGTDYRSEAERQWFRSNCG
jgi:hypothetical protein